MIKNPSAIYLDLIKLKRTRNQHSAFIIELTGLSEFSLRGWENRCEAFNPQESEEGRCEYNKKDIEKY